MCFNAGLIMIWLKCSVIQTVLFIFCPVISSTSENEMVIPHTFQLRMRWSLYGTTIELSPITPYVTSTLDHVLTASLPRSENSRTWRGRGQNVTISDF